MARYELSLAYFALGEYAKAIDLARWLIRHGHDDRILRNVYVIYGSCLDNQGHPEEAVEVYGQGLQKYPDNVFIAL